MRRFFGEILMLVAVNIEGMALWIGGEPIAREILARRNYSQESSRS